MNKECYIAEHYSRHLTKSKLKGKNNSKTFLRVSRICLGQGDCHHITNIVYSVNLNANRAAVTYASQNKVKQKIYLSSCCKNLCNAWLYFGNPKFKYAVLA